MLYSLLSASDKTNFKQTALVRKSFATLLFIFFSVFVYSASSPVLGTSTFTANKAAGTWSNAADWTVTGGGSTSTYPGAVAGNTDIVVIPAGMSVTITANVTNTTSTIDVQGTGSINTQNFTLTCTGLSSSVAGGTISKSTGTLTVNGGVTISNITFTGAGTLNVSGNWNVSSFTASTSTVAFNGAAQSINSANTFNNLSVTTAGTKSLAAATIVGGALAVSAGTFDPAGFALTVTGTTTVNGTGNFTDNNAGGINTFGNIALSAVGATLDLSADATANVILNGNITNTFGTFNVPNITFSTGAHTINNSISPINWSSNNISIAAGSTNFTFNGSQLVTISGTAPVAFLNNLTVSGAGGLTLSTSGAVSVAGLVTVSAGSLIDNDNTTTTTFSGGLAVSGGTLDMSALSTVNVILIGNITNTTGTFNVPNITFSTGAHNINNSISPINWSSNNISIAAGSGAFTFSGTQLVTISGTAPVAFLTSLAVSGAGGLTLSTTGAVSIGTTVAVTLGSLIDNDNTSTTTFGGNVTLNSGAIDMSALSKANCIFNAGTITSAAGTFNIPNATFATGAFTIANSNTPINWSSNNITIAGASTNFTFSGSQLVTISGSAPVAINGILTVSGAGGLTLSTTGAVSVGSTTSITAGTLTLSTTNSVSFASTVTVNGATASLVDNDNTTTTTFGAGFILTLGTVDLSALSTANVVLIGNITNSAGTFTVPNITFSTGPHTINNSNSPINWSANNISIAGASTAFTFNGSQLVTISGTAPVAFLNTLTVSGAGGLTLSTSGAVSIASTTSVTAGTLTLSTTNTATFTSTVTVNGATASLVDNDNTTTTTFNGSCILTLGTINFSALSTANCIFNGAVTNTAGTFNVPTATIAANGQIITATQSTNFSGGVNITGAGALTFSGAGGTILGGTTSPTFPAAITVSAASTLQLATTGVTTVTTTSAVNGTLDINGKIFAALGNITIGAAGTLNIGANGTLRMANGTSVANSGIFKAVGTAGNLATVTNNGAGNYTITQAAVGAFFHSNYATFRYTNGTGVSITNGNIDPVNDFDNTNFTNGSGTCYLNLTGLNITSFAVNGANFDAGPTYNVQRTAGTGTITFNDATGTLAYGTLGEANDNDNGNPGTLINWVNTAQAYYSGGNDVFSNLNNWWTASNGTGSHPSVAKLTDGTSTFIVQSTHVITVDQNLDILNLQSTGTSTLTFGNNGTGRTVIVEGDVTIGSGTTWNVGATAATHILDAKGNFTNNGTVTFMPSASRIVNLYLDGNTTTYTIGGTSSPSLANVTVNSAAYSNVPYTAAVALNINGTLTINTNGSFNAGNFTHIIAGNWTQATAAGFTASTSTIQFTGTGSIGGAANPITFNNVTCNGATATIFAQNVVVNGDFLVNNNTTTQGSSYTLTYNGNFTVAAGSTYVAGATSTANFSGGSAQAIDFTNASFNTMNFTGAGVKNCTGTLSSVSGVATVAVGATVAGNATMSYSSHLQIDGTCNWSGSVTMNGAGAYIQTSNGSGTYSLGTADLTCTGTIWLRNTVGGIGVNPANLAVGGNLIVNANYLVLQNNTSLTGVAGKTLTLNANSNLYCRGVNNFPTGFGTYALDVTSTVYYDQNINQTVRGNITYGILNLNGSVVSAALPAAVSGTVKTVDNPIDVNGNLTLAGNNVVLDLNSKTGNTFAGATLTNTGGTCVVQNTGGTGSFLLDADDANQTIQAGVYTFNNFTITQGVPTAARTKTINSNITLTGNFYATNPGGNVTNTLTVALATNVISGSATRTFTLDGNVILSTTNTNFGTNMLNSFTGAKTFDVASTVNYNLGGAQTIASSANVTGGLIYGNINMGGSGNKTPGAALDINGNISSSGGVFVDAGLSHTVAGDWLLPTANYTATGTITLDGTTQNVSLNTVGATTFNNLIVAGSGTKTQNATVNINGNFTVNSGPTYSANTKNINIAGNWSQANGGVFTQTYSSGAATGITTFNGTVANQTVNILDASSNFGAVIINKAVAFPNVTFASSATISSYLDVYGPNVPNGAIAGGIDFSNQSLYVGDNFYIRAGAAFVATGSTLYLNGSNNQDIILDCDIPILNNLDCSSAGTKRLRSASGTGGVVTITNNVNINGSTLDAIAFNSIDLFVAGNWYNTGVYTGGTSRTVTFNGAAQTIDQTTFGNVIFSGTNTKTLTGAITASNNLTINNGTTLDVGPSNYSISVGGIWDNSQGGAFVPQQGTVTFIGNSASIYTGTTVAASNGVSAVPAAGKSFYNVTLNKNAGQTLTLNTVGVTYGDLNVTNDLTISVGTLSTNGYDVFIGGNFTNTGVITMPGGTFNSAISLTGTGAVTKNFDVGTGANVIRDIFVNAGATTTYSVINNLTINNNNSGTTGLIVTSGTFDLNGKSLTFGTAYNGNVININGASGTFNTGAGGYVYLANRNIVLNNGGTLKVVGTAAFPATFTKASGATGYTVSQTGATSVFHAKYFDFEYLNAVAADGGVVLSGGSIDPINCFTNGTFSNGLAGSAQYIDVSCNSAALIADNVTINTGPLKNIKAGTSTGTLIVNNATGTMSTFANENDDGAAATGHVQWTSGGMRWTGATTGGDGVSWNNPLNWSSLTVPTASDIVVIDHSTVAAAIAVSVPTGVSALGLRLTIDKGAGAAISVTLNGTSSLTLGENLAILNGSNLTAAASNAISVAGNWTVSATSSFTAGSSTVTFAPTAGTKLITPGPSAFNNIVFGGTSTCTVTLGAAITANGNITISGCTFDVTSANLGITANGNWSVSGTGVFNPRAGTVTFSKAGAQTISGSPFYNFTTGGSGTKSITANLSIYGSVTIAAGTVLDGAANTLSVGLNWSNAVGAAGFTQTGVGTVLFNGGSAGNSNQNIDGGAAVTTFNNVTVSSTGTTTWSAASNVNGDFTINSGTGTVNMQTFSIVGTAGRAFTMSGTGNMQLRGVSNFPASFGTYSLASNSTVTYIGDLAQNIKSISSPGYGNLTVQRAAAGTWTKTALGDLIIQGNLTINDINTVLDVNTNSANIVLTGNLAVANGYVNTATAPINWGTGTTTITHNGAGWNIDADITRFNNMILSGTGTKTMFADLTITGSVTVNNSVSLTMGLFAMNCTAASKIFTLNNGSQLNCALPSPAVAFPTGFATYSLNVNSLTYLNGQNNSPGDQTVKTTGVTYGNLRFADPNTVNRTVNIESGADLVVAGYFWQTQNWIGNANNFYSVLNDNSKNITVGGDALFADYIPSAGTTQTFNGSTAQQIRDYYSNNASNLIFGNVVFSNGGTKTFGDGNDDIVINGNLTINAGAPVTTPTGNTVNIAFNGTNWTNNGGTWTHVFGTLTYTNAGAVAINVGTANTFYSVVYNGVGPYTYSTSNGLFTGPVYTVGATATVDMGTLSHTIAASAIVVAAGGTWTTTNANLTFNRNGNQTIPGITARNILCSVGGTKTLSGGNVNSGNWIIQDLTIATGVSVDVNNATPFNITVAGNWANSGTFTPRTGTVTFNGTIAAISVNNNLSNFYICNFQPLAATTYTLGAASTTILLSTNLNSSAYLFLNGNILIVGSNTAVAKSITVAGTLEINANAALKIDNTTSIVTMNVNSGGTLKIVGTSALIGTITRQNTGGHQININSGASIQARYYLIEYLSDAGFYVDAGATLDPTNNFSDGTWSNMRVGGAGVRFYLDINCPNPGGSISNTLFNYAAAAPATGGNYYNVKRGACGVTTGTAITFTTALGGVLGDFSYEYDGANGTCPLGANASTGNLIWPTVSTVTWTGATNTDWHTATNWSPNIVPTSSITAIIPLVANNPIVSVADAYCKGLSISNGQLQLTAAFDLITSGDIQIGTGTNAGILSVSNSGSNITCAGNWTRGTNGVFTHGGATVTFIGATGASTIAPLSSAFNNVTFNNSIAVFYMVGATVNIAGNVYVQAGQLYPNTANYTYNVTGNFDCSGGTFSTITAGTVVLNGTTQSIVDATFSALTVSGTGTKTTTGVTTVAGITTVNSGATLAAATSASTIDFNGNVTFNAGSGFADGGNTHTFSAATWTGNGTYSGTGQITFDRPAGGAQTIAVGTFNNIRFDNGGQAITVAGNVTTTGDFYVSSNINVMTINSGVTINNTSATGAMTLEANEIITCLGTNSFPTGFASYDVQAASTVNYNGTSAQNIYGTSYGNLTLNNANTKTMLGDVTVKNNLTFNAATLDVSASNYFIYIQGNWNNNSSGTFVPQQGQVWFNGTTAQQLIQLGSSAVNPFYDLIVQKATQTLTNWNKNVTVTNDFKVLSGFHDNNTYTTYVGGNLLAPTGGGTFTYNNGTYYMNNVGGNPNINTNGSQLMNLTLNGAGTTFKCTDNLTVRGDFNLLAGTFNGNSLTVNLGDNADGVTINGTYKIGAAGVMAIGSGTTVAVNGTIEAIGTSGSIATITRNTIGGAGSRYGAFQVNSGGTIKAQYYLIEYMSASGILVNPGALIDVTNNFSNGTFNNGIANGVYLEIENNQRLTTAQGTPIVNVSFSLNPGGTAKNVKKTALAASTDTIEFYNATGVFAGASFETDPNSMVNWTGPKTLSWNGSVSTDWNTAANWTPSYGPSIVPTGAENVIINNRPNQPLITGATGTGVGLANNLTINASAILTITTADVSLTDLTVSGDITINGTLNMSSTTDGIFVSGNWQKAAGGSVSISNGNVNFNSTASKNINNGTGTFGYVTLSGTSTYSLGAATIISKDLTINSGSLDVSSSNYQISIGGNFVNIGTIIPRAGKIVLNAASGTKTFNPGTTNYYNIDINCSAGGIYQLTSTDLSLSNNMNIISGTLSLNGRIFNMGDGVGGDFLSITGTLSANAGSSLKMGSGSSLVVNSGGTFSIVGTRSNIATLTRQTGTYGFTVNSGGTMAAKYYLMEYMNATGIYLNSGANLNAVNNFSNGTFANGVAGGQFMRLDCSFGGSSVTADSVVFNSGPAYNCYRTTGADVIIFNDPSGSIGNYSYEFDNTNPVASASTGLINWVYTNPTVNWTGATSTNWSTGSNWDLGVPPDATMNAIIGPQANNPIINTVSGPANAKSVLILASGIVTVSNNQSFTMSGNFSNSGTLTVTAGSTSPISVGGSWSDLSVVNPGSSTVTLTAAIGTKSITSAAASTFNNLTVNGAATFNLASAINVSGNLTISAGTLDVTTTNYAINVAGNWSNSGTFTARTGTVTLTGTTTQAIASGTGATKAFYNLTKSATSTSAATLSTNIDVTNDFVVNKGSMNGGGFTINTGGNFTWSNTSGALTNVSATFSGTVTKTFSYTNGAGVTFTNVSLTKSAGTGVILANSLTLSGTLTMTTGNIILGARNLTLGNTATITGGSNSSYVQADGSGHIIKNYNALGGATLSIPMGDINDYDPMTFKLNGGTLAAGANVAFNVTDGLESHLGTATNYISRWWDVAPTGITGAINYDISYTYTAADVVGPENALIPSKYSLVTSPNWICAMNIAAVYSINTTTHKATWMAVPSFSHFTAAGNGTPTPIELLSFDAVLNSKNQVDLVWSTATEANNDYFTIERSGDAINFEVVVNVPGAGNSNSVRNYATVDYSPLTGVSYYRLKQTDFNGNFKYSDVVSVNYLTGDAGLGMIQVYPNPADNDDFNIGFRGFNSKEEVLIVVYDVMGNELYAKVVLGDNQTVITAKDIDNKLASGVYFVIASNKKIYERKKFIIR